jgi:IS1 family transposase
MNKLPTKKRAQILSMLCEGMSMRSISRICDVSLNTVTKLLAEAGEACIEMHDELVRDVTATHVQADEVWSFVYAKDKTVPKAKAAPENAGSVWTWTAIDREHKMILSYFVGDRTGQSAVALMDDLRARVSNRMQLSTDGHNAYLEAVEGAFGGDVDYAQLIKIYGSVADPETHRYSPPECVGTQVRYVEGARIQPCTSHVERSNLSFRMHNRRFTRLTNAHSKKFQNHCYMVALYAFFYNFIRKHLSLRMTPAMAAGVAESFMEFKDILARIDAKQAPKKRGPYKKRPS